jgi:aspartate racemase
MLGILGGMGPAATADFFTKLVRLTPAGCDQEHIPVLLRSQPQTPDRSAAILGTGASPLPALIAGLRQLVDHGALAIAIPCNSSHHWFDQLQGATRVPILHIADAAIAALPARRQREAPVAILATRGTLHSGYYQRKLEAAGYRWMLPGEGLQTEVDAVIAGIKGGAPAAAAAALARAWRGLAEAGARAALMACTEIPVAAGCLPPPPIAVIDTNLELARACVAHALAAGWWPWPPGAA